MVLLKKCLQQAKSLINCLLMNSIQHFVDGKIYKGTSKKSGKVFNPAIGEQSSQVSFATADDVNHTVSVAKRHL